MQGWHSGSHALRGLLLLHLHLWFPTTVKYSVAVQSTLLLLLETFRKNEKYTYRISATVKGKVDFPQIGF